jgi:protein-tyrosine phosphatase/nicotinamidase-related amidase/aminoglycoside phosphotransferase (APT) family kinase protein
MPLSVIITQCLQHDFVAPLMPHDPLPNKLHVGAEEARRLLGVDPARGPLSQFMFWVRSQQDVAILHIRDWHNPQDPAQREHLKMFGQHCIEGSEGARLVMGLEDGQRSDELYINCHTLNDFEGTTLAQTLEALRARSDDGALRVAVIGVWTEAKITFLLYDLLTRGRVESLATCSALTASASRAQHFNALEQLKKILGVEVFDSVGDLGAWLKPDASAQPAQAQNTSGGVTVEGGELGESDLGIVQFLYRDSAKVALHALSGGFSGAAVYRVQSWDALGHAQSPSVLKLGPRALIGKERASFERVELILGNDAPSVRGFVDLGERAGLKYAYASMGRGEVRTFKALYASAPQETIDAVLREVFGEILERFTRAAQYERLDLIDYYTFAPRFADSVRAQVAAVVGELAAAQPRLRFVGGLEVRNVADFYQEDLALLPKHGAEAHFVSYVHGDLNGANILIDGRDNVWLIDFFHAHRGHVLRDVAKLENDLLYIFTPLEDEGALEEALRITAALRRVEDLRAPLGEAPAGVSRPQFLRAWETLRTLRGIVAELCRTDRHPAQLSVALLRYAAHTLTFDESSALQKRWALAAAGGHAEDVVNAARRDRRLRVDWIEQRQTRDDDGSLMSGRVGLTICPGRKDRGRDLEDDVRALRDDHVEMVVNLVTQPELDWAGVEAPQQAMLEGGIHLYIHEPIRDQDVPSMTQALNLVRQIRGALRSGQNVMVHCMGGLGRSGTIVACALASGGLSAQEAIAAVRVARGPRAVENRRQEDFVQLFIESLSS